MMRDEDEKDGPRIETSKLSMFHILVHISHLTFPLDFLD